jgi:hypothetical protein
VPLKYQFEKAEEIPAGLEEFYIEKDGKWEIVVEGMKTEGDIQRLSKALATERDEHKATKSKLKVWADLPDHEEVILKLDRLVELEATVDSTGKAAQDAETLAKAKFEAWKAPIDRELSTAKQELLTTRELYTGLVTQDRQRTIREALRTAAIEAKVIPIAIDDVLMYQNFFDINDEGAVLTREGSLDPKLWLTDMQTKREHWWGTSIGGGSKGSNGPGGGGPKNPWHEQHWNMTEQAKIIQSLGLEKAKQMAERVGSSVGATKPTKVTK